MTTPAQEGTAAAKRDDEAWAEKVFVLQYHSFDKSDRDDGDWIIGIFKKESDAEKELRRNLRDSFGGIKFSDLVENKDALRSTTEYVLEGHDGFKYVITPTKIK